MNKNPIFGRNLLSKLTNKFSLGLRRCNIDMLYWLQIFLLFKKKLVFQNQKISFLSEERRIRLSRWDLRPVAVRLKKWRFKKRFKFRRK